MLKVYFVSNKGICEYVATFANIELFELCLPQLEDACTERGFSFVEHTIGDQEINAKKFALLGKKSKCPFCGGTKTTPFTGGGKSQNCTECDKNGMIANYRLKELELTDFIER